MKNTIKIGAQILIILMANLSFSQEKSEVEIRDMKYMLEEEKVARDVYEFLDETWNLRVFNNIKQSEQTHFEMMKSLLETNSIDYKVSDKRGVFYNKDLQKMYDNLIERGSKSKQKALQVGKLIEETDITDLEKAIENAEDTYIKNIYSNLLRASQNHLRAFNRQLSRY